MAPHDEVVVDQGGDGNRNQHHAARRKYGTAMHFHDGVCGGGTYPSTHARDSILLISHVKRASKTGVSALH
jgi:hypothetical protein